MERRYFKTTGTTAELRDGLNGPMIAGYGVVFNKDSEDLGGFIEQIDPGAASKTIQEADVRALANHDVDWLLGRAKAGTLRLRADASGVFYEIDVNPADPDGQRAIEKVRRGDMDGSSFSFECLRDEWDWDSKPARRRVLEFKMIDIGPVTFPAYPDSTAAARALDKIAGSLHRPVGDLVGALATGEIRSLITEGKVEEEKEITTIVEAKAPAEEEATPEAAPEEEPTGAERSEEPETEDRAAEILAVHSHAIEMMKARVNQL